jgi:hypothetical protein
VAGWFETYLGLEQAAWSIGTYEVQFVPGLLQTAEYARAVTVLGHRSAPAGQIERRVQLRLTSAQSPRRMKLPFRTNVMQAPMHVHMKWAAEMSI